MRFKAVVAGGLLAAIVWNGIANATDGTTAGVDALFSRWTAPDAPGCAVSVVRGQAVVFEAAYGQAVIETGMANTVTTGFNVASVSKQFTAFAVHLLNEEGRLSLADDVRKYVPELHDFGSPITLGDLLHHTSGLRDYGHLLLLQGRRYEDTTTQGDALAVITAQRELNFAPGSRFAYSNTNYLLLALVVERVSGQAFPSFMEARVFEPLEMTNSFVQDDARAIQTAQAWPYAPVRDGYERRFLPNSTQGASNIRTTAKDMAIWAAQFDAPRIGSPRLVEAMSATTTDAGGRPLSYASGLIVGRYRGAVTVEHGGSEPGYAAEVLRLPEHRLAISILCNVEGLDLGEMARRITDLYLGDVLEGAAAAEQPVVVLPEEALRRFAGTYKAEPGAVFAVELRDGRLFMQGHQALTPVGAGAFVIAGTPARFSFEDDATGTGAQVLVVHDPDNDRRAERVQLPEVADLTPALMDGYAGRYFSEELGAVLTVERRGEGMWLSLPGFGGPLVQPPQMMREQDVYYSPIGSLAFGRAADGRVTGVAISDGAVVGVRYIRMTEF